MYPVGAENLCETYATTLLCDERSPYCPLKCRGKDFIPNINNVLLSKLESNKKIGEWLKKRSLDEIFYGVVPEGELELMLNTQLTKEEAETVIQIITNYLYTGNGQKFMLTMPVIQGEKSLTSGSTSTQTVIDAWKMPKKIKGQPGKPSWTMSYEGDCDGSLGAGELKTREIFGEVNPVSWIESIHYCLGGEKYTQFKYLLGTVIRENGKVRDAAEGKNYTEWAGNFRQNAWQPFCSAGRCPKEGEYKPTTDCADGKSFVTDHARYSWNEDYAETFTYLFLKDKYYRKTARKDAPLSKCAQAKIAYFPARFAGNPPQKNTQNT